MNDSGAASFDAAAIFYDLDYGERPDVGFWAEHIPRWGRNILEVGCGTGRIIEALQLKDGSGELSLQGFDISPRMVEVARMRTGLEALGVGDMRDFSRLFPGPFDCVVIPFNSLMHLETPAEWQATFREVRRVLASGGVLAFSILNPSGEEWDEDEEWLEEKTLEVCRTREGIVEPGSSAGPCETVLYRKWYRKTTDSGETGLVHLSFAFLPDGEEPSGEDEPDTEPAPDGLPRVTFRFPLRYAYPSEVMAMLDRCGFEMLNLWGGWDEEPADEEAETLIFVARAV